MTAFSLRRTMPATPIKPVPKRPRVPGSGADAVLMLVSPLEIVVWPLKKPLPVLMVNCTVAPSTVVPLYHVPVKEPVRV